MGDPEALALADDVRQLLQEWVQVASQQSTYDNVDVVATTRRRHGHPGLAIQPDALLRNVQAQLGGGTPPADPTALALYGAALINPLPVLGVASEIRGRVLSATSARQRLEILQWGITRSLRNLRGIQPL